MKSKTFRFRRWLIALITIALITLFIAELMKIQIVDAAKYQDMLNARYLSTQTIKPVRGEIVDRDGQLLAGNRMGYDVQIDKATFPSDRASQNEILHRLTQLFDDLGEEWNDNLPLSSYNPYSFLQGQEDRVETLKSELKLQSYATAAQVMDALIEKYRLEGYQMQDARKLAAILYEMDQRHFSTRIPYLFASDLDLVSVIQIRERSYELPGVEVVESAMRIYEDGDLAPHIIGTIGAIYAEEYEQLKKEGKIYQEYADPFDSTGYFMDDVIGKDGVEKAFEEELRGLTGRRDIYVDASNTVVSVDESIPPVPGNTVVLTLDRNMQSIMYQALEAQIQHLQTHALPEKGKEADNGAAVVMNVKTGEILAAVTYPSYDLATYRQDYSQLASDTEGIPLLNRAIMGQYTPGSIFKPTVAIAGLHNDQITASSTFVCNNVMHYNNQRFTCLGYHGPINVGTALRYSCNIFFYETGLRVGIDGINDIAKQLGLGEPTGIEITEAPGQRSIPELKEPITGEPWYPGDVLQSSIGQMLNRYTPLQLANYAATIANRGTRMDVTIVHEIRDYSMQHVVQPFEPKIAHVMTDVDPSVFETIVAGMVSATDGTAGQYLGNYPIPVASKTGTPETGMALNSTFIAFAPVEDPEIAVAVVIENGYHGYTGAPVAKAAFDTWFGIESPNSYTGNGWDTLRAQWAREAQATDSDQPELSVESSDPSTTAETALPFDDRESQQLSSVVDNNSSQEP